MRFLALLGLGVLAAAVAVGLNLLPVLQQTGMTQAVLRIVIIALVLFGLWRGLSATNAPAAARRNRWLTVAMVLVVWAAVAWTLAAADVFEQGSGVDVLLAIFLPLIIGLPLLLRSSWLGRVLDMTPPAWLTGLQVYRVFGTAWIVAWATGALPGAFALPAGIGDTLVGMLAVPVAGIVSRNPGAGVAWNVLGILDLADAIVLSSLVVQGLMPYPLILIPTFAVPLSLLLHAVSLRQLRRGALGVSHTNGATKTRTAAVAAHLL